MRCLINLEIFLSPIKFSLIVIDEKLKPEDIKIKIISNDYDIKDFKSYEKELVDFLIEDALENQ